MLKNWIISNNSKNNNLHKETNIPDIIVDLLFSRGIIRTEDMEKFMKPQLSDLYDPFLLKDMDKAVERIVLSIAKQEKLLIYGDYDVDGITSSSMLYLFLKKLGVDVEVYIPSRFEEGYGLSLAAIDNFKDTHYDLIITVDCGITSIEEVEVIKNLGIDIIVTDHHQCQERLPNAIAVINPHRSDCKYPFKDLCGAGVIFKLISALSAILKIQGMAEEFLDIVALGTVADIVPLIDENRIIVFYGLQKMNKGPNKGIQALIETSGLNGKSITAYSLAFGLAPRLNAAGRLGDAKRSVRLLIADSENEAKEFAMELNSENMLRQQTEGEILDQVIKYIDSEHDFNKNKVIVAYRENWHHGVIGIVASKIVDRYYRPCIILSNEDGFLRGSGRSIDGFNIFQALTFCSSYLDKYGGHEKAAGLSIEINKLNDFKEQINCYANDNLVSGDLIEKIYIDAELKAEDANLQIAKEIKNMAPFGEGNPAPVFVCKNFKINSIKKIGDGKHLKLVFASGRELIDAVAFNMGDLYDVYKTGDIVDFVCSLDINNYNNIEKVQLIIKDIRVCEEEFIRNGYYSSVNYTVLLEQLEAKKDLANIKGDVINTESLLKVLRDFLSKGEKCFFLLNDIDALTELYSVVKTIDSQIRYRTCIGEYIDDCEINIYIIINPKMDLVKTISNGNIFIVGRWLDYLYLKALANAIDNDKLFLYNNKLGVSIFDGTGFDKEDVKAIYKYIWGIPGNLVTFKDINNTITLINKQYNRLLKAYNFRKCIEVLDEVCLIKADFTDSNILKIEKYDNSGKKIQLEESKIYRKYLMMLN